MLSFDNLVDITVACQMTEVVCHVTNLNKNKISDITISITSGNPLMNLEI